VTGTRRQVGPLLLDLIERDARCEGRRLHLHPREFALLWRLSDADGEPVGRLALLRDVWQLRHPPETNSVAVHVCRLRRKLAAVGLATLILTEPGDAGYRLMLDEPRAGRTLSIGRADEKALDAGRAMRELTAAGSAGVGP
jgi:two-component system OmpR family response regulator